MRGKIKEYDRKGNLLFEGEYLYNQRKKGKRYINGKLEFEGIYLFDKKWNGKGYDLNSNSNIIVYELENGAGTIKEYDDDKLIFEGDYLNGKKMEKEKNMILKAI